jgi:hypothetical protein
MGIYSDGNIYGISIKVEDLTVYEKIYDEPATSFQIQEAKDFYKSIGQKGYVLICIKSSSTYILDPNSFISWVPSDLISK